jgi:tetratricopeptide (TPR) repeat protein
LALIDLETSQIQDALSEVKTALSLDPANARTLSEAAYILARSGREEEARSLLSQLFAVRRKGAGFAAEVALAYLGLGERDRVSATLQQGIESRNGECPPFGVYLYPAFQSLDRDARYQALLARLRAERLSSQLPSGGMD